MNPGAHQLLPVQVDAPAFSTALVTLHLPVVAVLVAARDVEPCQDAWVIVEYWQPLLADTCCCYYNDTNLMTWKHTHKKDYINSFTFYTCLGGMTGWHPESVVNSLQGHIETIDHLHSHRGTNLPSLVSHACFYTKRWRLPDKASRGSLGLISGIEDTQSIFKH